MRQQYTTKLLRETRQQIGARIHAARIRQDMPLDKLSKLTGIPVWQLDFFELGKGKIELQDLVRLRCVLGI